MNAAVKMNRSAASTPTNGQLDQCRRRDFLSIVISSQYHALCGSEPEPHACDKARGGGILAICSCEVGGPARLRIVGHARSEEHTSELQSLMRNSYAVFC